MDYKDIQRVNETIITTNIKGKEYAEVNQRIKAFRMLYPEGRIVTDIISLQDGICTMKASVYTDTDKLLGTGYAQEKENSTFINKTSFIENCETSCIGRALGMCGIGIDTSVASAEEVANAINNQNAEKNSNQNKTQESADTNKKGIQEDDVIVGANYVTEDDIKKLIMLMKQVNVSEKVILDCYKVNKLNNLSPEQYINALKRLYATKTEQDAKAKADKNNQIRLANDGGRARHNAREIEW